MAEAQADKESEVKSTRSPQGEGWAPGAGLGACFLPVSFTRATGSRCLECFGSGCGPGLGVGQACGVVGALDGLNRGRLGSCRSVKVPSP